MDFPAYSTMPFWAILETDFRAMLRTWLVRIWAVLVAGQTLFTIALSLGNSTPAADGLAGVLAVFPLVWSTFVILFCGGAVASESGVVADSILSKAVTRSQYLGAKLASRLLLVLVIFLAATLPAALIIGQNATGTVDTAGVVWAFVLVASMLMLLTSLTVAFSTLFDRTLVAVGVVWFLWYMAGGLTSLFDADFLSPIGIVDALPAVIAGDYRMAELWPSVAGFIGMGLAAVGLTLAYFGHKDV